MAGITPYTHESWKKTNADRIRAMSDEELAEFLDSIVQDWHQGTAQIGDRIIDSWLDWLKEEVKGESDAGKEEMESSDFKDFCQANLGKILGGDPNG